MSSILSTAPHRFLKKRELTRAVELLETLVGGEGGIRTHGTSKGSTDFESAPFDHSGTSPLKLYWAMASIAVNQTNILRIVRVNGK